MKDNDMKFYIVMPLKKSVKVSDRAEGYIAEIGHIDPWKDSKLLLKRYSKKKDAESVARQLCRQTGEPFVVLKPIWVVELEVVPLVARDLIKME